MAIFTSDFLARATGGTWTRTPEGPLLGFTQDTRRLAEGQMFVAIRTGKRDGHAFLGEAEQAGASAALVSQAIPGLKLPQLVVADTLLAFQTIAREHRRRFRGPVIAISGSAGKTSTKSLLATLLGGESRVLSTEGNLNNHLGVPLTLTRIDPEIHAYAVIEVGISLPGEMAPLAAMIEPDIGLITMVGPAHLEALGSLENVAREKAVLPRAARLAIVPASCRAFEAFRSLDVPTLVVEPAEVIRPEVPKSNAAHFALSHRENTTAISLACGFPVPRMFLTSRVSDGMAENAVLAICTALRLGIPIETVQARLADWRPPALRAELRREGDRLIYLDCYNANPASMSDALANFLRVTPDSQPRLLVLGGMEELGSESVRYHRALGRSLKLRSGDYCFFLGRESEAVRIGAVEAGVPPDQFSIVDSIDPVVARLVGFHGSIFIKGSRKYALERVLGETVH